MSKDVDAIQFRNDEGEYVYAKTHLDAIDGIDNYLEALTWSIQFMGDYIEDSGWVPFDYNAGTGVKVNTRYTGTGFECAIRDTTFNPVKFGNGNYQITKMIRINAENFSSGMQLFQLPIGFVTKPVRFQMSGSGHRLPYTLEILADGKVMVFVHPSEQDKPDSSNWIYGQYTWIE